MPRPADNALKGSKLGKLEAMEKLETLTTPKPRFEATVRTAPLLKRVSDRLEDRRLALRLILAASATHERQLTVVFQGF